MHCGEMFYNAPHKVRDPRGEGNLSYEFALSCNGLGEDDVAFYGEAVDYSWKSGKRLLDFRFLLLQKALVSPIDNSPAST